MKPKATATAAPKRPRGRPRKNIALPTTIPKTTPQPEPPPPPHGAPTAPKPQPRSSRLAHLLNPQIATPAEPAPEQTTPEKASPTKATPTRKRASWKNLSRKIVIGADVASSFAIENLTDREPLDPSEEATEELEEEIAEYGRQKIGEVDLPTWLTLMLALIAFIASKYIGAPRRPKELPEPQPKKEITPTPPTTVPPADLPQPPVRDAATPAASQPRPSPPVDAGNVGLAETGW